MYGAGEAYHQLDCLGVVETLTTGERLPGVELDRVSDRGSQPGSFRASSVPAAFEHRTDGLPVLEEGCGHLLQHGQGRQIAQEVAGHPLSGAEERIDLGECEPQPLLRILDRSPR